MVFTVSDLREKLQQLGYARISNESIDSEVESNPEKQQPSTSTPRWSNRRFVFITCLILIIINITTVLIFFKDALSSKLEIFEHKTLPHCGSTVPEARARNCIYDVMANGWTPQECYNKKLEAEFLTLPESKWYYDEGHMKEIPMEVLKLGNLAVVFPADTHHDRHCLYTWRKLAAAAQKHVLIDYQSNSVMHAMHCTDFMLGKLQGKPVKSERKFVSCVEVGSEY